MSKCSLAQQVQHPVHPQRGRDYLRRLDYHLQQPRPRHAKAQPDLVSLVVLVVAVISVRQRVVPALAA